MNLIIFDCISYKKNIEIKMKFRNDIKGRKEFISMLSTSAAMGFFELKPGKWIK